MTRHFDTLDAMRGVAAVAVLVLHVCKLFDLPYAPNNAHLGVDFFFLLSGLVIANAYERKLRSGWSFLDFLRTRAIRLAPMILIGGALGFCTLAMRQVLNGDLGWSAVALAAAPNLVLLPSPALLSFRPYAFPLNMPFWSLSVEVAVNLAYAASVRFLSNTRLSVIIGVSLAAWLAVLFASGTFDFGFYWRTFGFGLVRAVFPFLLGVAVCRLAGKVRETGSVHLLALGGLAAVLLTPAELGLALDMALVTLAFPALLALGLTTREPKRLKPAYRALGDLSYPLYAVHYPIVVAFAQADHALRLSGAWKLALASACFAASILVAWASLVLIDKPIRARLSSRLPRTLVPKASVAAE